MSKSRKFEGVLDECLERLLVKNETVEQCLRSFPQYSNELKSLLETALATRRMSAVRPAPDFRDRARQQFKSVLQETGRKKNRVAFDWSWQPRWATAVAIVLVLSLVGGGTVAAASGSMPDSPLYGVKLATEQVQLALASSELGKAELHARLADKRVTEIIYLAEADKPEKIALITEKMNAQLGAITALVSTPEMASSAAIAPAVEQVTKADEAPAMKQTTIAAEAPTPAPALTPVPLPPQAAAENASGPKPQEKPADKATPAISESEKKSKEASQKDDRQAKLKTTVENQANTNVTRLRVLLETAPESAKPAIQKALNQSETEYKKAIEALK